MESYRMLVVYVSPRDKEQKRTLDTVRRTLVGLNVKFKAANRDRLNKEDFKGIGLVIAVGGDGTFLRSAQFIGKQLIFGVNADVKNKEGFFMKANKADFEEKISKIINGKFKVRKLPRLEAFIDNKKVSTMAVNEFFIGAKKSYHAAKYMIQIDLKKERQKSSGILVTTPTGSYAWARSCYKKIIPLDSKEFQYLVREPYEGKVFKNYKLKHAVLGKNKKIEIFSEMLDGIIVADSVSREYSFKNASKATVRLSSSPLSAIWGFN